MVAKTLVHHGFLISYWRYWKRRIAFGGALLLCVATAFLIDDKFYFTAGVIALLAAIALISIFQLRRKERARQRARAEKLDNAKVAVAEATKTGIEKAKSMTRRPTQPVGRISKA